MSSTQPTKILPGMTLCGNGCTRYGIKKKLVLSLWVALACFITFIIVGTMMMKMYGTSKKMGKIMMTVLLYGGMAAVLGYGIGLLMMAPWEKNDKCSCPMSGHAK